MGLGVVRVRVRVSSPVSWLRARPSSCSALFERSTWASAGACSSRSPLTLQCSSGCARKAARGCPSCRSSSDRE